MSMETPILPFAVGHRGAAGLAPENTLAGFRRAAQEGVTWVEFDVRLSGDGVPVVFHDDTLERTTNGHGKSSETPYAELAKLDAGSWFSEDFAGEPVPAFSDVIRLLADLGMSANVEIKPAPGEAEATAVAVCALIRDVWPSTIAPPLLSSFDKRALLAAKTAAPEIARAMIFYKLPRNWKSVVEKLGCGAVHLSNRFITKGAVDAVLAEGMPARVFTVNKAPRARELQAMGVSSVFTDRPDLVS